jgi:orotate phosphoribosyltransferase
MDAITLAHAEESLQEHIDYDKVFGVEMAVGAITHAVASICRLRDCKENGTVRPWEVRDNFRFGCFRQFTAIMVELA